MTKSRHKDTDTDADAGTDTDAATDTDAGTATAADTPADLRLQRPTPLSTTSQPLTTLSPPLAQGSLHDCLVLADYLRRRWELP